MGYGCGDSFPFDFEPNGIPFGSENRKENCHFEHIPLNLKGNRILAFSVYFRRRKTQKLFFQEKSGRFRHRFHVLLHGKDAFFPRQKP